MKLDFISKDDMLLRHVDDFLLVTNELETAKKYIDVMELGITI